MSAERRQQSAPAAHGEPDAEPLGVEDLAWRDDLADPNRTLPPVAAPAADDGTSDDAADGERTIDADPAWLAELLGGAAPNDAVGGRGDDAERTVDTDPDLVESVRAAAREARAGLAAPPPTTDGPPTAAAVPATEPEPEPVRGIDARLPPPPVGVGPGLPAPVPSAGLAPPAVAGAAVDRASAPAAATIGAAPLDDGRWRPPARLRPAPTPADGPLLPTTSATRRALDWRWALAGVLVAAVVGFLIAIAVGGDDSPSNPEPSVSTAPGATTTSAP
jgi:hypothetical protein